MCIRHYRNKAYMDRFCIVAGPSTIVHKSKLLGDQLFLVQGAVTKQDAPLSSCNDFLSKVSHGIDPGRKAGSVMWRASPRVSGSSSSVEVCVYFNV
jgi:hypothetical protein